MQEGYKQLKILLMICCCLASSGANSVDIIRNILSHSILVIVRSKFRLRRVRTVSTLRWNVATSHVQVVWFGFFFLICLFVPKSGYYLPPCLPGCHDQTSPYVPSRYFFWAFSSIRRYVFVNCMSLNDMFRPRRYTAKQKVRLLLWRYNWLPATAHPHCAPLSKENGGAVPNRDLVTIFRQASLQYITELATTHSQKPLSPHAPKYTL